MSSGLNVCCTGMGAITVNGPLSNDQLKEAGPAADGGTVADSMLEKHFEGIRGAKYFDKCTKMLYASVKQHLNGDQFLSESADRTGIAVGTSFSSLTDYIEFLVSFEKGGFRAINPMLFPNTVHNCPASQLAILLKVTGVNITITNGICAGLDALISGYHFIKERRVSRIIVGGVEESSHYLRSGFTHSVKNCKNDDLDPKEAVATVLLENRDDAVKRGAPLYGEILGSSQSFHPHDIDNFKSLSRLIERNMVQAMHDANISFEDVGIVSLSANGLESLDNAELSAVGRMLDRSKKPKVLMMFKKIFGETLGASGILQLIALLKGITVPMTEHYQDCFQDNFLRKYKERLSVTPEGNYLLINSLNWEGNITSVIVEKMD